MDENFNSLKRYKLLITLVFILLVLGVGCWLVENRDGDKTNGRKDEVLRKLDQRSE